MALDWTMRTQHPATGTSQGVATMRRLISLRFPGAAELPRDAQEAIANLPVQFRTVPANTDLMFEGQKPATCSLVLEGLLCRYKHRHSGERQILSLHLRGEIPDAQCVYCSAADFTMAALAPTTIAQFPLAALLAICDRHPAIAAAIGRHIVCDAMMAREWLARVGHRDAIASVAQLFCEMAVRCRKAGLSRGQEHQLPITQAAVADALSLSAVHVNRMIQELRRLKLFEFRGGVLTILDWERLADTAAFDPSYLCPDAGNEIAAVAAR